MSNGIKITELTSAAALDGAEALPIVQGSTTVKATAEQLKTLAQTDMPAANITGTLPVAHGGTGVTTSTGSGNTVLSTSPTLVTPALGTPASGVLTNATGLPIATGVSGLGTGVATALAVNVGSAGAPVVNGGALGTPASGTATNLTGLPLTTGVTGTLPAANGGTAQSTYATGDTLYASALNTVSKLTIGSAGQVLTVAAGIPSWATLSTSAVTTFSAGTTGFTPSTATSGAITLAGTLAVANGGTGVTSSTGTGSVVLSASPTFTGTLTASAITTSNFLTLNSNSSTFAPINFVDANAGGKTWSMGPGGGGTGAGNFGLYNVTNSNQVFTFSSTGALTLPAALTYGGVTLANSVTGTGSMVLSASPTLTGTLFITGTAGATLASTLASGMTTGQTIYQRFGKADGVSNQVVDFAYLYNTTTSTYAINHFGDTGTFVISKGGNVSLGGTLTYGGVTLSNSVTGTGSMVLSASPTFTGTLTAPTFNATTQYNVGGAIALSATSGNAGYTSIYDSSANIAGYIGGSSNAANYWQNTTHYFRDRPGSTVFASISSATLTSNVALNYGGVTLSNSVTGTGSMVLSASPTFTGTPVAPTITLNSNQAAILNSPSASYTYMTFKSNGTATWDVGVEPGATGDYYWYNQTSVLARLYRATGNFTIAGGLAATTGTFTGALTYGGVTLSNSVTGTGSMVLSASPTFSGTPAVSNTPTASWGLDFSGCTVTIANGGNAPLPTGSGQLLINETGVNGGVAIYLCGGGVVVLVGTTDTGVWQASTTTPSAGHASVAFNGAHYTIYNNQGASRTFGIQMTKTRNAV